MLGHLVAHTSIEKDEDLQTLICTTQYVYVKRFKMACDGTY